MQTPQQPPDPDGPSPAVPPDPDGPSPAVPRGRRTRLVLALVGGVLALLCLGGGVVAFTLYDNATRIERDRPDIVAISYVTELFSDRDRDAATLWTCDNARLPAAEGMLDDIIGTEQRLDTNILVHWEGLTVRTTAPKTAEVRMQIRRSGEVDGLLQSFADPLTLTLEDRDGWRVCAAAAA